MPKVKIQPVSGNDSESVIQAAVDKVLEQQPSTRKRRPATVREKQALGKRAAGIRDVEAGIIKLSRTTLEQALKQGDSFRKSKEDMKHIDFGLGFKKWMETICMIIYSRGYKYMRLAEAAEDDPEIKKMGLTEALEHLGLVTRRGKNKVEVPAVIAAGADDTSIKSDSEEPVSRTIANLTAFFEHDVFVLELEQEWENALLEVVADTKNLTAILNQGGLLIRLKPADEMTADDDLAQVASSGASNE